jgi:hypothetical protein
MKTYKEKGIELHGLTSALDIYVANFTPWPLYPQRNYPFDR